MNESDQLQQITQQLDAAARLTTATATVLAGELAAATKALAIELAVQRELAEQDRELAALDREQVARMLVLLARLVSAVDLAAAGTVRLEQGAAFVAEDLAARERRADLADTETPGAGADAALRSPGTAAEAAEAAAGSAR